MKKVLLICSLPIMLAACDSNGSGNSPGATTDFSLQAPTSQARSVQSGQATQLETIEPVSAGIRLR